MSQWLKVRLGLVSLSFFAFFTLVGFRLVQLQVLPNQDLYDLSKKQFTRTDKKAPFRLPIFDRNHEELAISVPVTSIYAHPKKLSSRKKTALLLSRVLGGQTSKWLQKLDAKKNFVWVQRQISDEKANELKKLKIPGIGIESENKRIYPNGTLAAHVLGYTDIDGNGLSGVELSLNQTLLQERERRKLSKDGKGNTSYFEKNQTRMEEPQAGISLTLDRRIQAMVEQELDKTKSETRAQSVMAVVMNPFNGEILAYAQRPGFDPNTPTQSPTDSQQNKIIQSLYEPGSTLKVLFAAEALEKQTLTSASVLDCGNGKIKVGNTVISESDKKHNHHSLSLEKVIAYSSNVGAVRVAQKVGAQGALDLLERFGLTRKTGVELSGETSGQKKNKEALTPLLVATMGFGQGISTTPLQLISAFSPFANGGFLVSPTILKSSTETDEKSFVKGERIISEETALEIKNMLLSVTEDPKGTGYLAKIPGVRVAGKTGTAQKYDPQTGYKNGKYYSSFIGFLPAENPQFLIGVMVDEPKSEYYASLVASPLFKRIAEHSLHILNRSPSLTVSNSKPVPR
ncbi:penicillin-binding protein 2, partial [bacterium]|nr:penicillin-binding protein 2 [bacterium]